MIVFVFLFCVFFCFLGGGALYYANTNMSTPKNYTTSSNIRLNLPITMPLLLLFEPPDSDSLLLLCAYHAVPVSPCLTTALHKGGYKQEVELGGEKKGHRAAD